MSPQDALAGMGRVPGLREDLSIRACADVAVENLLRSLEKGFSVPMPYAFVFMTTDAEGVTLSKEKRRVALVNLPTSDFVRGLTSFCARTRAVGVLRVAHASVMEWVEPTTGDDVFDTLLGSVPKTPVLKDGVHAHFEHLRGAPAAWEAVREADKLRAFHQVHPNHQHRYLSFFS